MPAPITTDVKAAAAVIRRGGLAAFATETVYGLGANALDATAAARIFDAKQRPAFDPLIVHIADRSMLDPLVQSIPAAATKLMDLIWPGPLTLVLPKRPCVPDLVTSGLDTVGVRLPAHEQARELIPPRRLPCCGPERQSLRSCQSNDAPGMSPNNSATGSTSFSTAVPVALDWNRQSWISLKRNRDF